MKKIGLTGGVGTGKSTVAKLFAEQGALILDADQIARELRQPGGLAHSAILKRFQTDDRMKLRQILSTDPSAKQDLEAILHPLIRIESDRRINAAIAANPAAPVLVYEATLLIEAGRDKDFDEIVVVTSPLQNRIKRITLRDQIDEKAARLLIEAQNDDSFRLPHAHYEIKNHGQLSELKQQVIKVLDQIISA
jgi:dephospho-CoA kinase